MVRLTDLPDEVLLEIFSQCFHLAGSTGSKDSAAPICLSGLLHNYTINKRLQALAHQTFFETYVHDVHLVPNSSEWNAGTLLHDLYSPTFSCRGHMRNVWEFVAELRMLKVHIKIEDPGQINTAVHEAVKELKRYPRLRRVWMVVEDGMTGASYSGKKAVELSVRGDAKNLHYVRTSDLANQLMKLDSEKCRIGS